MIYSLTHWRSRNHPLSLSSTHSSTNGKGVKLSGRVHQRNQRVELSERVHHQRNQRVKLCKQREREEKRLPFIALFLPHSDVRYLWLIQLWIILIDKCKFQRWKKLTTSTDTRLSYWRAVTQEVSLNQTMYLDALIFNHGTNSEIWAAKLLTKCLFSPRCSRNKHKKCLRK